MKRKTKKSQCLKRGILILLFSGLATAVSAQNFIGKKKDLAKIVKNIEQFSQYYMKGDYKSLAECYTVDAKLFPDNTAIIHGQVDIEKRWVLPENVSVIYHKVTPLEIRITKNYAYDFGYYEGETLKANGEKVSWKGKYVIVWQKVGKDWKIYLDIWNRV